MGKTRRRRACRNLDKEVLTRVTPNEEGLEPTTSRAAAQQPVVHGPVVGSEPDKEGVTRVGTNEERFLRAQ